MGLMDKFKNLFTEEVEDEVEEKEEPIKKEVMQVEIPSPVKRAEREPVDEVIPKDEDILPEPKAPEKKEEYKFPFFDDEDFNTLDRELEEKPVYKKSSYRKEKKEVYNPVKEEKKIFHPTPIISPVYGILDKNYQKEDIKKKGEKPRSYYSPKEATVDEIRNKAYGTLEDDLETTLFGRNRALFEDEEKKEEPVDVALDSMEADEEVIDALSREDELDNELLGEKLRRGLAEDDELTDLLEEELSKDDLDLPKREEKPKKRAKKEEPKKISDTELFDMIDSMYQKGDK